MDDLMLRQAVLDELEFDPSIEAAHIGVAANKGVVTLTGRVSSFAEKIAAERAAMRVRGVKAVAQEILVRYPEDKKTADDEIAARALKLIAWHASIPPDAIKVKVQDGVVTLSGAVPWHYQRSEVEAAVRRLGGVVAVINTVGLRPTHAVRASEIETRIREALKRNAECEGNAIHVSVPNDHTVRLEGQVQAWSERSLAQRAAWSVPGITNVEDRIVVV